MRRVSPQSRVEASLAWNGSTLVLSVRDDGPGFTPEGLRRGAEPFYRGDGPDKQGHLGLGLNICRVLCEACGGGLEIANAPRGRRQGAGMVWRVKRFFVSFAGKKQPPPRTFLPGFAATTDTGENVRDMGMTVYFLRHGQTAWNAEKRLQGQTNVPLNDEGRRQAREAGGRLPAIGVCLTSPLQRARETALLALGGEGTPMTGRNAARRTGIRRGGGAASRPQPYDDPQNPMYYYGPCASGLPSAGGRREL